MNVFEGTTWKMGAIKLAGRFTVPEEILRQFILLKPGDQYSQRLIAATEDALRNRLNEAGFGYAEVAAVPIPNPELGEIALTFQIEPNARTYVRRINFEGVQKTRDDVLRREMRQLEGAVLSNARWPAPRSGCSACHTSRRWRPTHGAWKARRISWIST